MSELITSAQNPKIKKLLALQQKSSERRECGLFDVEGVRELQHCIDAGFTVDSVFIRKAVPGHSPSGKAMPTLGHFRGRGPLPSGSGRDEGEAGMSSEGLCPGTASMKIFEVSPEVYEKIAYRGSTEGVIAEVRTREMHLEDLELKENPLIMVLESVEKPGNLGAILRSADAAGADAVIVCDPLTDLFNPNLIRSSIGGIFSVPTVVCSSEQAIRWLKANRIQILTAQLQDSSYYYDTDMRKGTAIVMGTEATGLTDIWREAADAHILIPMLGRLDSLNVSVSAAILLFEAVRQRSCNNG